MSENLSSPASSSAPMPRKSRSRLTIGVAAGSLVLCLLCIAIATGVYLERDKIPAIGNLFPTPTRPGILYISGMDFSLRYPPTWVHEEQGRTVTLTSSQEVMDATTFPASGALINFGSDPSLLSYLDPNIDGSSPVAILGQIVDPKNPLGIIGGVGTELEPIRSFSVGENPAASAVYTYGETWGQDLLDYVIVIVSHDTPIVAFAICSRSEWATYRPIFDGIVASLDIGPMP